MYEEKLYDERINKMLASQWPVVCAYLNECEDEGSGGWKKDDIIKYCEEHYPHEEIEWFVDTEYDGAELMALLKGTNNDHAFNIVIIRDWLQIPEQHLEAFRQAIRDARIDVKETFRPTPINYIG